MQRRTVIRQLAALAPAFAIGKSLKFFPQTQSVQSTEKMLKGPFKPDWLSLEQYTFPDWFRDAKFGIWAHWGPQCQPERGDWYARNMYIEGSGQYKSHLERYGHPSKVGFKDITHEWKAEAWDPDYLLGLYKRAGAQYFVALANHHDNFDNYNSKYQEWNSVKYGPKKDLIKGWEGAARKHGLRFGVSVHASHAWTWYEPAQGADKNGAYAGIPYDGKLQASDGNGKWWRGLDPQGLYAQNHPLSADNNMSKHWAWGNGASIPDKAYCQKFFNRTLQLINDYNPDLLYFDDTVLPLYPVSNVGLEIAAHYYNSSLQRHGRMEAVINGKILNEQQRKCMVWDIERGQSNEIEPLPWQTDTCIGNWHYDRPLFERHGYKSAQTVVHTLADVVSKNGNLLLSIPVRGNGTIDPDEESIVEEIGRWMHLNGESIFGTRPWRIYGEGPAMAHATPMRDQGFNEGKGKAVTGEDIRFTTKGNILYAIALGNPVDGQLLIRSLAQGSDRYGEDIAQVQLVSDGRSLPFSRSDKGLLISLPEMLRDSYAYAVRIIPRT